jgi:hypothetical protein
MATDYRSMFDRLYIGAWDLVGKDVTVRISRVVAATLTAPGGRHSKKPVVYFEQTEKGFALNKTNAKTIASLYGNDTEKWVGERITIYPTQTTFGAEMVEAIRVRPTVPKGRGQSLKSQPVDHEMRAKQSAGEASALVQANGNHPEEPTQ